MTRCFLLWVLTAAACTAVAHAQLSGTYTCANGNPGNAFDYGDIGDFFDDLEAVGISGPVVMDVYDDGGPFDALNKPSYALGRDNLGSPMTVPGLSATNTLTIRAALGEFPQITGASTLQHIYGGFGSSAPLSFHNISFTTLEGLTIGPGPSWGNSGLLWSTDAYGGGAQFIRISRCRIFGHRTQGLSIHSPDPNMHNVIIENNWIYGVNHYGIYNNNPGLEWIVRHNTIVAHVGRCIQHIGQNAWGTFENNIVCQLNGMDAAIATTALPQSVDGNIFHLTPPAWVSSYHETWAQWQASGRDLNGLNADPLLMNTTPGFEDLRLQPGSPARDFVTLGSVAVDIFGNPRPMGFRYDAGAHEFPEPSMRVDSGAAPVANAGAAQVGDVLVHGGTRDFTIRNTHAADLLLSGNPPVILTPGANLAAASVQSQPGLTSIPFNGSTTFTIYIEPAAPGPFDLQISIDNNDVNNHPYTFTVNGNGIVNAPAVAAPAPGSGFTGVAGGPYYYAVDPGDPLVNAELELSDPEGNQITVTGIAQFTPLVGVNTPVIPPPGQPITLAWTGMMDAVNPLGLYEFRVEFHDAVNGTPVMVTLYISNNDLPPTHTIAGAAGGNGTPGNPYTAGFTEGDDGSHSIDLAALADPNTGQAVSLGTVFPGMGNPAGGAGFAFTAGSTLTVAPAGTLTAADAGTHTYLVQITDGTNVVDVHVTLAVAALPPPLLITTTTLPDGEVGQSYNQALQATGGLGGYTFSVIAGSLPQGLTLSAAGQITGIPITATTETFTVQATDTATTATQQLTLTINPAPTPPPIDTNPGTSSSNCTATSTGPAIWWLLLIPAALAARRRWGVGQRGNSVGPDGPQRG